MGLIKAQTSKSHRPPGEGLFTAPRVTVGCQWFFGHTSEFKVFKISMCGVNFIGFLKIIVREMSFGNWLMAVWIWLFFDQFRWPLTRKCTAQKKHSMPLNDSTHKNLRKRILAIKSDVTHWRHCYYEKCPVPYPIWYE